MIRKAKLAIIILLMGAIAIPAINDAALATYTPSPTIGGPRRTGRSGTRWAESRGDRMVQSAR
jgi:hypothetical protein